ncbi:MAG: ISKra4 family transposase [Verrucomicrobia bacterium]|nr:ISKra4 family transposase [Verrucomicrobiota bacterium]
MTSNTLEAEKTSVAAEVEALLPEQREAQLMGLAKQMQRCVSSAEENLGHLEEQLLRGGHELMRQMLEKAAKADAASPRCPVCQQPLRSLNGGHRTTIQTRFGAIQVQRARGKCRRCHKWRFPADAALGLPAEGTQSPAVQEIAALTVSKMPAAEAAQLVERLVGVKISAATLGRQARQQGERAQEKRQALDEQMSGPDGRVQQDRDLQLQLALEPFTLVIELDAWNIRERDAWGESAAQRARGAEPPRWHWVYGGTCFRLAHRGETAGGRATILSRGYAMTRGGIEALREQLWAEASRRGLGRANEVLIVADGAVWIWHLAGDRFPQARQRVDFYHVSEHLWTVARALHPDDESAARAWVEPLLAKLKADEGCAVITELAQLRPRLEGAASAHLEREINYLQSNRQRLDYGTAKARGEPLGSGAMESTCRQYQCRFKRPGQFWTQTGDEALLCLETIRRNGRWHLLFPHSAPIDPSKN